MISRLEAAAFRVALAGVLCVGLMAGAIYLWSSPNSSPPS
jgi:hypothetical protein